MTYRDQPHLKGSIGCLENQINSNHLAGTQLLKNLVNIFKLKDDAEALESEMTIK